MVVAPNDYAAWSEATGNPYPASPADKAAVTNQVIAWKSQQTAAARESRGPNALASPLAIGAGTAGLGLAGLLAFNHFRRQGLAEPHAAELAKNAEDDARATVASTAVATAPPPPTPQAPRPSAAQAPQPVAAPPPQSAPQPATPATRNYRQSDRADTHIRSRDPRQTGPNLRGNTEDGPTALTLETRSGRSIGGTQAREQGQYKARSDSGFHDPALANLDTPEKRNLYLAAIVENHGSNSPQFSNAQALIRSMETTTPAGVDPTSFIQGLNDQQRYGTTTAEDQAQSGNFLAQSRQKSNASAQAGFRSREGAVQSRAKVYNSEIEAQKRNASFADAIAGASPGDMGATDANNSSIDPEVTRQLKVLNTKRGNLPVAEIGKQPKISIDPAKAEVFFTDSDGSYKPYLGTTPVVSGRRILSSGRLAPAAERHQRAGSPQRLNVENPIAESDLAYFPTDDPDFYARTGNVHPFLSHDEVLINAGNRPDLRFATDEDQGIKGMLESLSTSDPRFGFGVRKDGISDNWTVGRVNANGERQPLDVSGFQSEMQSPGTIAGSRLKMALQDHSTRTGQAVPQGVAVAWAADLAQQHGVDTATVINAVNGRGASPAAREPGSRVSAPPLAAGTGDALDRVYNSLGMHATENAWDLEHHIRSGNIKGAAAALAAQLPALTAANASGLRGIGQDEKLNIVAEGIAAGLKDLSIATEKYPEAATKFGIGKGAGGFGVDGFLKSYVRDWVTVRGLQLDPSGQPTYQVPNDAFEILAHQASASGHSTLHELENHVRGSANGLQGALKIDRIVSSAQSTKPGDPNNHATAFAQTIFDLQDPDLLSTRLTQEAAADVKLSFGTRRNYDVTAGFYDRNPNESQIDDANSNYRTLRENDELSGEMVDTTAPYGTNATLAARVSGADYKTPEGNARIAESKAAQQWITTNADRLERERADLNRGIINLEGSPRSFGRGFVISADQRGAYLAGDTQGMNTSIRDENFNDGDTTPLDRAQDNEREALINNQIVAPEGIDAASSERRIGVSEADDTARQYGATKLYFKNLGPNSRGAMSPGDAFYPRQALRRLQAEQTQDRNVARSLNTTLPSWQAPQLGNGRDGPIGTDYSPRLPDSAPDQERQAAVALDRRTLQHSTQAPYVSVMSEDWKPDFSSVQAGITGAPRAQVTTTGDITAAANYQATLDERAVRSGTGFRDDENRFDAGELSGTGRPGNTFAQKPIAAEPVSAVPAAAIDRLNTLRSSMERPAVADYTDREAQVARVSHGAEYMDKLYANGLTRDLQPKQVGDTQMREYAAPSDAAISGRVKWLRKAGIL